jgi:hypothetical protein
MILKWIRIHCLSILINLSSHHDPKKMNSTIQDVFSERIHELSDIFLISNIEDIKKLIYSTCSQELTYLIDQYQE